MYVLILMTVSILRSYCLSSVLHSLTVVDILTTIDVKHAATSASSSTILTIACTEDIRSGLRTLCIQFKCEQSLVS